MESDIPIIGSHINAQIFKPRSALFLLSYHCITAHSFPTTTTMFELKEPQRQKRHASYLSFKHKKALFWLNALISSWFLKINVVKYSYRQLLKSFRSRNRTLGSRNMTWCIFQNIRGFFVQWKCPTKGNVLECANSF